VIGGELNGLGVCRSLGRAGIPVYLLDRKRLNPAMWSRYATALRTGKLHGRALLDALRKLHRELGCRPALIATDEMALLTISEFRDELADSYRFHLPPHATVLMLHNKALFHEYALANDLPVPNSVVLRRAADIAAVSKLRFPVIIKPADKRYFHFNNAPRLITASGLAAAERAGRQLLAATGEVIVQERAESPDNEVYFSLFYRRPDGQSVMFTGRKLACNPPGCGSTVYCMHDREAGRILEPITHSLLEKLDYAGFGGVEYKWDALSGRFVIIEPTVGRTDWQEEIATLAGANIPLAGYCHEYGLPFCPEEPHRTDVVWQSSHIERMLVGAAAVPAGATVIDGYWRRDDPVPGVVHYLWQMLRLTPAIPLLGATRIRRRHAAEQPVRVSQGHARP
jgi:predicted ATP-grasp superfamily ATP-dependent carboligase